MRTDPAPTPSIDTLIAEAVDGVADGSGVGLAVGTAGAIAELIRSTTASTTSHDEYGHTVVVEGGAARARTVEGTRAIAWRRPTGPHTHLLPDLLAHGRTHAATDPIPDGQAPVFTVFPPHPTHDPLGRPQPFDGAADARFDAVVARFGDPDEVRTGDEVRAAVLEGRPVRMPAEENRAARRGREVALRRLAASGHRSAALDAWRAASASRRSGSTDPDQPFHEAHG